MKTEYLSRRGTAWRRLRADSTAMAALAVLVLLFLFAFAGPSLSPYRYDQQIRQDAGLWPCPAHPFGTDRLGRDLMVRCMIGTRISLCVGMGCAMIVTVIGCAYGSVSGLLGGRADMIMMRVVDMLCSVPEILLIVVLRMAVSGPLEALISAAPRLKGLQQTGAGLLSVFLVYGLLYWTEMARVVRGQILQLKNQEFVIAARLMGCGNIRLIRKHLLPNCAGQILTCTMLQIPSAIFTEAFLSFLGLGVSAPLASLGSLASEALNGIGTSPYRAAPPALLISLIILSFTLFGDSLRDALDPKTGM